MHLEALIAIGAFVFVFGAILLVPGLWWARRRAKRLPPDARQRMNVTPFGIIFYAVFICFLMFALGLEHIAPEISGGKRVVLVILVIVVGILAEKAASKLGLNIISGNDDRNA